MPPTGILGGTAVTLIPAEFNTVFRFKIANFGRTIAIVDGLKLGWDFNLKLPQTPDYKKSTEYPNGVVLTSGGNEQTIEPARFTINCPRMVQDELINNTKVFRLFISVIYSDFMSQQHHADFCWQWGCPEGVGDHHFFQDADVPTAYNARL
jgi:hypothetical protein